MPREDGLPPGTLVLLILRVLASQPLHGYAIAQRISQLSHDELSVEEGSLYPALQKLLLTPCPRPAARSASTASRRPAPSSSISNRKTSGVCHGQS